MTETPSTLFRYCPRCGLARDPAADQPPKAFRCASCGFLFFFNPAVAAAVLVVRPDGRGLFIRRAKDPAKGRLALVGGFVDPGENAEGALRREVREEVGLELDDIVFLSSSPNDYHYSGTTYPVVDLIFSATTPDGETAVALDGVDSLEWIDPNAVDLNELAFQSMRDGIARYRERIRR